MPPQFPILLIPFFSPSDARRVGVPDFGRGSDVVHGLLNFRAFSHIMVNSLYTCIPGNPPHLRHGVAMLDYIRSNAQSWGVKLAFAVIILVFIFWGVGSLRDTGTTGVVAKVNGKPILYQEYATAYQRAADMLRQRNPGITREQLQQAGLGRQILQELVAESLLFQEAERVDLAISPLELRRHIAQLPSFQNEQGKFDPEIYKRLLAAQRTTPGRFEEQTSKALLEQKLRNDITAGAWVSPEEARALYDFTREQRILEYVFFPAADHMPAATPGDDELKAYYESHRAAFAVPAKVNVEYIAVRPADLGKPEAVADADINAWYEKNTSRYSTPARLKVRHILLRLDPKASEADVKKAEAKAGELETQLRKGGDFAALAAEHSEDADTAPRGGELGWITQGDTVAPFEAAALALKPGEISAPVRTDFGLHIIKLDEREDARVKPLAEVRDEIRARLAAIQGGDKLREVLDNLIEANIVGKPLAEAAAPYGLKAETSGLVSAADLQQRLGIKDKDAATLLSTPAGTPVDTAVEISGDGFMVARIAESKPAATRDFAEVSNEIAATLRKEKALAAAGEAAAKIRKEMNPDLPDALVGKLRTTPPVTRSEPVPGLPNPQLTQAAFAAPAGEWLSAVFPVETGNAPGVALVRVKSVTRPDDAEWQPLSEMLRGSLESSRKEEMFRAFLILLHTKAKVELVNPSLLEQEGM